MSKVPQRQGKNRTDREGARAGTIAAAQDELAAVFRPCIFWLPERQAETAWIEHVPFAFWLVDVLRPSTIVELGTHNGVSYSAMCQAVKALNLGTRCYAVDTWKGDEQAGFYSEEVYRDFESFHDQRYNAFSRLVRSTFDEALPHFEDGSIDLLHIDGLHTYDAVRHDYESWLPKLSTNAVVIFHDTNVREREFGVAKLWSEINTPKPHFSFLHAHGLGVLGIGRNYSGALHTLFNANQDNRLVGSIREIFGALGRSIRILSERPGLDQALSERDGEIADLRHRLAERDGVVNAFRQSLAEREVRLGAFDQLLSERNGEIADLRHRLAERDGEVNAFRQSLAERDGEVNAFRQSLAEREVRLGALDQSLSQRDGEIADLRHRLAERELRTVSLEETISAIRASTSWRITAPLRSTRRLIGRCLYSTMGYPLLLAWRAVTRLSLAPLREWGALRAIRRSGRFNREWYLKTYPDVAAAGIDPIRHYVAFGAKEGRDPGPSFSTREFLADNPNVAIAGVNRLLRFLSYSRAAGRAGKTSAHYLLALANIRLFKKLFNSRNVSTALIHIRRGQFRILFARSRHTIMREAAVNSNWILQMRSSRASMNHALRSDRTLTRVITRHAPHNGHAKFVLLPGYLTLHPELIADPKPSLNVSVSVVIPTYNGGTEFPWLIKKLKHQKGIGTIEIIIVDSGSRDGTDSIADELGCKVLRIPKEEFSHSLSRNIGAEHAVGDFLFFMVQDAYPIGDYWLYGLVSCLLHSHDNAQLAALSCTEYSRYDSELLYDALIDTHYKFLGCRGRDRVGSMIGSAHIDLRTQGQISDISCLIRRSIFQQFKFEGRYAEDLSLGIRLIRAGHKVAMLSSIPVIHAHRRSAGYYLRRVFVDVIFLTELFPDFVIPRLTSIRGTLVAAFALREALEKIFFSPQLSSGKAFALVIDALSDLRLPATTETMTVQGDFGFPPFRSWLDRVEQAAHDLDSASVNESMVHLKATYLGRLSELGVFLKTVYPALDEFLAFEMNEALEKTLAMALGAQLAFHYVTAKSGSRMDTDSELIIELQNLLIEGI